MIDLALDTRIFIETEFEAALQELDLIFNTENTELIGYPEYGTNWHQYLWQLTPSPEDLRKYVYEKTWDSYFLRDMIKNVTVYVYNDDLGDLMYVVQVDLEWEGQQKTKIYKIK